MKVHGEVDIDIHVFLTSALVGGEWSASSFGPFAAGTLWIRGWVDPRAGLDEVEKWQFWTLTELVLRSLGRPACSQSLYRLGYRLQVEE
jgi:hypothetical protein